jgi:ABC-type multidrug transport system fused ATPase/permease subunit
VLEAGRIVDSGSYGELLARDGLFARLAEQQGVVAAPAPKRGSEVCP